MRKPLKEKMQQNQKKDLKIGEGFLETRGYVVEGPMPKHNGLNINNEPHGLEEREEEKRKRR